MKPYFQFVEASDLKSLADAMNEVSVRSPEDSQIDVIQSVQAAIPSAINTQPRFVMMAILKVTPPYTKDIAPDWVKNAFKAQQLTEERDPKHNGGDVLPLKPTEN